MSFIDCFGNVDNQTEPFLHYKYDPSFLHGYFFSKSIQHQAFFLSSTSLSPTTQAHSGTAPQNSMQIKTLFLKLSTFATAFGSVNTIIQADSLPCVPSNDGTTCLLNYEIRSGAALDLADPDVSASAFIYSHTCLPLGHKEISGPGETPIFSWGLSFSNPLVLGSEKRPDINWWTPWFAYDGRRYAYEDCACQGTSLTASHKCSCQFRCNLWVTN
ncbi:hypothetical protein BKA64DRAFT_684420 [Cadophora sp. MPI-SDFR-AT-0126]|nr:hypothetical protein BKA64DRAFT_684420 [Leotiomycetes sp. MPI-SDFR-AT-0126]